MNKDERRDFDATRQIAGRMAERWSATTTGVYDEDGTHLVFASTPALADYIVRIHNLFLPMCNTILILNKKLADRRRITTEMKNAG